MSDVTDTPLGAGYLHFLGVMHRRARPRTYLEIGVMHGASLALVRSDTRAIGVDPAPRVDRPLPRHATVCAETSDDFFAHHDVTAMIGTIDIAFVDGLHLFEQALRDVANLEPLMSPGGVILVHDCYPPDPTWTSREPRRDGWAGDVWKVLPALRDHRPDLRLDVVGLNPTGLGVITNLDGSNRVLRDRFDEIVAAYLPLDYEPWPELLPGRWADAAHLFPEFRAAGPLERMAGPARWAKRTVAARRAAARRRRVTA